MTDERREAAIEAAAKAVVVKRQDYDAWDDYSPAEQAKVLREQRAAAAAYDATLGGEREATAFTADQIEAVAARMREGHWPDKWITRLRATLGGEAEGHSDPRDDPRLRDLTPPPERDPGIVEQSLSPRALRHARRWVDKQPPVEQPETGEDERVPTERELAEQHWSEQEDRRDAALEAHRATALGGEREPDPPFRSLSDQLMECEEALASMQRYYDDFREQMLAPIKATEGASIESMSWDDLLGVAVRNLNHALDLDTGLRKAIELLDADSFDRSEIEPLRRLVALSEHPEPLERSPEDVAAELNLSAPKGSLPGEHPETGERKEALRRQFIRDGGLQLMSPNAAWEAGYLAATAPLQDDGEREARSLRDELRAAAVEWERTREECMPCEREFFDFLCDWLEQSARHPHQDVEREPNDHFAEWGLTPERVRRRTEAAEQELERLREALRSLTEGPVQNIIRGFYERGHPGYPCIRSGWVDEARYGCAVADITAARAALGGSE
jgi:hypothetical protein